MFREALLIWELLVTGVAVKPPALADSFHRFAGGRDLEVSPIKATAAVVSHSLANILLSLWYCGKVCPRVV